MVFSTRLCVNLQHFSSFCLHVGYSDLRLERAVCLLKPQSNRVENIIWDLFTTTMTVNKKLEFVLILFNYWLFSGRMGNIHGGF